MAGIRSQAEIAAEKAAAKAKKDFYDDLAKTAPNEYREFQQLFEAYAKEQNDRLPWKQDSASRRRGDTIFSDAVTISDVIDSVRVGKPLNYAPSPEGKVVLDAFVATVEASTQFKVASGLVAPQPQTQVAQAATPAVDPKVVGTPEQLDAVETTFNKFAQANRKLHEAYDKYDTLLLAPSGADRLKLDDYLLAIKTGERMDRPRYAGSVVAQDAKFAEVVNAAFENNSAKKEFVAARSAVPGNTAEATEAYIEQVVAISRQGKVATTADVNHSSGQTLAVMLKNARPAEAAVPAPAETQVASTNPPTVDEIKGKAAPAKKDINLDKPEQPVVAAAGKKGDVAHTVKKDETLSGIVYSDDMKEARAIAARELEKIGFSKKDAEKGAGKLTMVAAAEKSELKSGNIHKIGIGETIAKLSEEDIAKMVGKLQLAGKIENGHLALGKADAVVAEIVKPKVPMDTTLALAKAEGRGNRGGA